MENKDNGGTPEAIPPCPKYRWRIYVDRCTLCRECIDACKLELLSIVAETVVIKPSGCIECGDCAAACGYYAISFIK